MTLHNRMGRPPGLICQTAADPLVQELVNAAREQRKASEHVSKQAGLKSNALYRWAALMRDPQLHGLRQVANVLGYDIVLVKREAQRSAS